MSVPRQSVPASEPDLEATAELPVLDPAAFEPAAEAESLGSTDTWAALPPTESVCGAEDASATHPAIQPPHDVAARNALLEGQLRALAATLNEVEQQLGARDERLQAVEAELARAHDQRTAAQQRAETSAAQLAGVRAEFEEARAELSNLRRNLETRDVTARAQHAHDRSLESKLAERERALELTHRRMQELQLRLTGCIEALRSREGQRGMFESLLRGLDGEVGARDRRLARMQREAYASAGRMADLEADVADRDARIAGLEQQVNSMATALARSQTEASAYRRANAELGVRIATLAAVGSSYGERIRTIEADADVLAREREAALLAAQARQSELQEELAAQRRHIVALETELAARRADGEQRMQALQHAHGRQAEQQAHATAAEARAQALEVQLVDYRDAVRRLEEELRVGGERHAGAARRLRAAEEAILRLEEDLRAKNALIDELRGAGDGWRAMPGARQGFDESDTLTSGPHGEAAGETAWPGDGRRGVPYFGAAAAHDAAVPEGATRLLIRADGDSEIVHVLGRRTSIGRTPDNDLQLDTKFISRHHAVILAGPVHTVIEDLNSTNGVLVNNRRVSRQSLKDGDMVLIGKTQLRFAMRACGERH